MRRRPPVLSGWKLYVFGIPLVYAWLFVLMALRVRSHQYVIYGARAFLVPAMFAAIATAVVLIGITWNSRRG
jgi:hypothetical protein